jgi:hypothetical protein
MPKLIPCSSVPSSSVPNALVFPLLRRFNHFWISKKPAPFYGPGTTHGDPGEAVTTGSPAVRVRDAFCLPSGMMRITKSTALYPYAHFRIPQYCNAGSHLTFLKLLMACRGKGGRVPPWTGQRFADSHQAGSIGRLAL